MNHKKNSTKYYILSIIFAICGILLINIPSLTASEITIESYIYSDGVTMSLNGQWNSGLVFQQLIITPDKKDEKATTYWNPNVEKDYISFSDNSTEPGFYITLEFGDVIYENQGIKNIISPESFNIFGKYVDDTPSKPTIGFDDINNNLNILPYSCDKATEDKFQFNKNLGDPNENFSLTGSKAEQIIFESSADCISVGEIRFDRINFTINKNEMAGAYSFKYLFTIYDGSSSI